MKNTSYDYVVIGSNLSGLAVATALSQETDSVLIIEGHDFLGQQAPQNLESTSKSLNFISNNDLSKKAIEFLSTLIQETVTVEERENEPQTFESGHFKPFVGFGQNSPEFYEAISYLFSKSELVPSLSPQAWTEKLISRYKGEIVLKSWVTQIKIEEGRATSLVINGQKNILASNIIFAGQLQSLPNLLPSLAHENNSGLNPRARQKLLKGPYGTAVELTLKFDKKICDHSHIHVLYGTSSDELKPCFGRFQTNEITADGQDIQTAQWLSLVDFEEAEDNEVIGETLKRMKRQIKRAYPTAFESVKFEKIQITPGWYGNGDLKLKANQTLPLVENLWVCSGHLNSQPNPVGALLQSALVLSAMGSNPVGLDIEMVSDSESVATAELL